MLGRWLHIDKHFSCETVRPTETMQLLCFLQGPRRSIASARTSGTHLTNDKAGAVWQCLGTWPFTRAFLRTVSAQDEVLTHATLLQGFRLTRHGSCQRRLLCARELPHAKKSSTPRIWPSQCEEDSHDRSRGLTRLCLKMTNRKTCRFMRVNVWTRSPVDEYPSHSPASM